MLGDILELNIFAFFLVFARIGSAIMMMPGFSTSYVTPRARLGIALGLSFLMTPFLIAGLPGLPSTPIALFLLLLGEIIIGLFFGVTLRVLVSAMQTAGSLIALFSSLANALIRDPIAEQQSSLISSFLTTLAITLIFVSGMHHLMIRGIVESYTLFVPGQPLPFGDFTELLAHRVSDSFNLGVQLSAPFIVSALVYYIGLGILGRLMPVLPVFFVAMPIQIAGQITLMAMGLSLSMMYFLSRFEAGIIPFLEP
ncbi:MAG: flagellar biosynthetic protein FliR [Rhodospirillaceae bacterium]|nr:flagellar biosynthetic protein FliR [Rhodospirillaceae bacterium]